MSAKSSAALSANDVALVVFGPDKSKKLHASRFSTDLIESAQKAAKESGFRAFRVVTDEQRKVASRLPKGRMSPNGRPVVPLIRPPLYSRILAVAGPEQDPLSKAPTPSVDTAKKADPMKGIDSKWGAGLVTGAVLLAVEDDISGWFECEVQSVDGETLTLKWQDWPDLPKFNRKVTQVAYLHPNKIKPF